LERLQVKSREHEDKKESSPEKAHAPKSKEKEEGKKEESTIRNRYFSSAGANPGSVFPTLLNLSIHHSAKLGNPVSFERIKGDLISRLDAETPFPAALSLADQGRFIVGYYHQRQSFFTKKNTAEAQDNE
jgi:CRISPR-associated protein Csd1